MTRRSGVSMRVSVVVAPVVAALALVAPLSAQTHTVAVETNFTGYDFDPGLGPQVANLLIVPVAYRLQWNDQLSFDLYGAYARGAVQQEGFSYKLNGPVDTRVKASYRVSEWAALSLTANIPTGNGRHDGEESVVASVLSSDLLGFQESNWGQGFGLTTGIATATQVGEWGVGLGASYRVANEYQPVADSALGFQPGNELRLRLGVDRNVGETGTLTAGLTYQNFQDDQVEGRNLFQAGTRVLVDGSYAFRAGGNTWTVFAADIWRENGDLFLDIIDGNGAVVGDTTLVTAKQNLVMAGVTGSLPVGSRFRVRPTVDVRIQSREESDGNTAGSGTIFGIGADLPLRVFGYDFFPKARFLTGRIEDQNGDNVSLIGAELSATIRWSY